MAPVLSDLYLAHQDRQLQHTLDTSKVIKVFRYVDDYLIVLETDDHDFTTMVAEVLDSYKGCMNPLDITHELPVDQSLRFQDMRRFILPYQVCWSYEPRGKKPLLPFNSAHSKRVKRSIARLSLNNAITKSCCFPCKQASTGKSLD